MKTKVLNLFPVLTILLLAFQAAPVSRAADVKRANTSNNLGNVNAWVGGALPGPGDVAVWDNTVSTAAFCTTGAGSTDQSWAGLRIANPAAAVVITRPTNARFFTFGSAGIDMSSAAQDFTIEVKLLVTGSQSWNIQAGRTFKFDSNLDVLDNTTVTFANGGNLESTGSANDPVMRLGTGSSGTVTINQSAGTIKCSASTADANVLIIGKFAGNNAVYNLTGGTLDADDLPSGILRIADQTGTAGQLNISGAGQAFAGVLDVGNQGSGTLTITGGGTLTVAGMMNLPRNSAGTGVVNLDSGTLTVPKVAGMPGGTFNFNSGTLRAAASAADFFQGLGQANVKEGGALIDSAGFDVTIAQPLLHSGSAATDGGVVKSGPGTVALSGASTYNGTNQVTGGKLVLTTLQTGGGRIVVADGAAVGASVGTAGTTLNTAGLVLGSSTGAACEFNLGAGNPSAPLINATNLETHGTITVNVSGVGLEVGQFTLIKYSGSIGGSGFTFVTGTLPTGVVANLVNSSGSVDLNVTVAPKLIWTAANSSDWDIQLTTNWLDSSSSTATYYSDGLPVIFDDTAASGAVQITTVVSPGRTTVTNDALPYSFNSFGYIGSGALKKEGPGVLTLNSPQYYPGETTISDGTLSLGVADALPDGSGKGNVVVNGTLDLAGYSDTINALSGSGIVNNSSGASLLTIGNNDASGTFSGVVQNSGGTLALTKTGAGTLTLSGNNSYSGDTTISAGVVQAGHNNAFGSSLVRFNAGTVSSDGTSPRTIPNNFVIGGNVSLGNAINSGTVILSGGITCLAATRTLTVPVEVVLTGTASDGGISKANVGDLVIQGTTDWTTDCEVFNGRMVLDGAAVTNALDVRPDSNQGSGVARLVLTNGALLVLNSFTANFRAGWDGSVTSTNYLDIAATVRMPNADPNNGKLILGAGIKRGVANILPGADLEVSAFAPADTHIIADGSQSEVNFDGGTVRPKASTTAFMQGLTEANVRDGGAVFDTSGFDITVAQPLLAAGSGGLTKTNAGTLTLTGTNTYTGASVVKNGRLVLTTAHAGGGAVTANDGSALQVRVASAGASLNASAATLGSSSGATAEFNLSTLGNPSAPVLNVNTLTTHGTVTVNVFGSGISVGQFTLIKYTGTIGGSGYTFTLGSLPLGVTANLVNNSGNSSVDLQVTAVVPLIWSGANGTTWDIAGTVNWTVNAAPTTYQEPEVPGPAVRFQDGATTSDVGLAAVVSPASVTVSNNLLAYSFLNYGGKISGPASLTKQGSGTFTLGTANDYTGATLISSGSLVLGAADALPDGAGKSDVTVSGTLDLAGYSDTINGLNGNGIIDASAGVSTLRLGSNNAAGAFSGQIRHTGGTLALEKVGSGSLLLSGNNSYAGGTTLSGGSTQVGNNNALGSGTITLSGGKLASDSTAARSLANALLVTANSGLGDAVNTGLLSFSGPVDFNGDNRNLDCQSHVILTGNLGNGSFDKEGPATLTTTGNADLSAGNEVHEGIWIIAGGGITNFASTRPDATAAGTLARLVVTNGASITLTGPTVNGRVGFTGGDPTMTNILDLAGAYRMPNPDTLNGLMTVGRNAMQAVLNFYPGGDLACRQLTKALGGGYGEVNFDGGVLRAMNDQAAFVTGLDLVTVRNGGVTMDSAGFNIGVPQALLSGGGNGGLTKIGAGTLLLNGANGYTGTTLVSEGALGGNGSVAGPVAVASGAALAPGTSIGQFTIAGSLTLSNGSTTFIELDKAGATNDVVSATSITYGGTLNLTNLAGTLAAGDSFTIFKATTSYSGSFESLDPVTPGPGLAWDTTQLLSSGTVSVIIGVATNPTNITAVVSGGNLELSWPADHTGWRLQEQTNPPPQGLTANWFTVPNSTNVNQVTIPIDATLGSSFFRLVYP